MKRYKFQEILLRILSMTLGTLILYIGYTFFSPWLKTPTIPFVYLLATGLLGLAINVFESKWMKVNIRSLSIMAVGIIVSVIEAIIFSNDFNIIQTGLIFILFLLVWNRVAKYFYTDQEFLYTVGQFYLNIGLLLAINTFATYSEQFAYLKSDIGRYTVIYIVIGVFLLIEIRNIKFLKNSQNKKSKFDIGLTLGMLAITFIISTQKVLDIVSLIIKTIYEAINPIITAIITAISMPFVYIINILVSKLKFLVQKAFETLTGATENLENLAPKDYKEFVEGDSPIFDFFMKFLSTAIIIIAILLILYFLYIYIDKAIRKKKKDCFEEDREFVVDVKLGGFTKLMSKTFNKVSDVYKKTTFNITADNKEKLRHEYKIFLQKLYAKKYIESENVTAWEVYETLSLRDKAVQDKLEYITKLYEEVRYGEKMPEGSELRVYRVEIKEVLKAIG